MFAEALKFLADQAQAATRPVELDVRDPRRRVWLSGDGTQTEIRPEPPPREHSVDTLDEIVRLATRFDGPSDEDAGLGVSPVVWYDAERVVLVIDDGGHRVETATLELEESDLFAVVKSLAGGTKARTFTHKEFVRLLRIDLAGALPPAHLLEVVRRLEFKGTSVATSEVKRTRESLGREITAAVTGEKDIPEGVVLSVPVYKTAGEADAYSVRCAVEIDVELERFALIPVPDEIERVRQRAVASIASRLADGLPESVPCYAGRP